MRKSDGWDASNYIIAGAACAVAGLIMAQTPAVILCPIALIGWVIFSGIGFVKIFQDQ